jgi:plastocyanin
MDDPIAILAAQRSQYEPPHGRPHFWPLIILVLILLSVAVVTLGQPSTIETTPTPTPSDTAAREARVYVVSYRFGVFSPTNLRIHAGDTVRWRNDSPVAIRVVAQLQQGDKVPEFDSVGQVQPGSYFSYTFPGAGTFGYNNAARTSESGVIIVR